MDEHSKQTEIQRDALAGKVILVTGAGKGIGRAVSLEYARQGATVLLLGKNQGDLEALYDEITGSGYPEPAIMVVDLGEPGHDAFKTVGLAIAQNFDQLDGIVHNAVFLGQLMPLEDIEDIFWDQTFQVNLRAPFLITRQCVPVLEAAPYASVIFTGEASGRTPSGYWGAYGISKAALIHMAKTWAIEYTKTSIRMNIIDPGPCRTGLRWITHAGMPMQSYPPPETITAIYVRLMTAEVMQHNGEIFDAQDWLNPAKDDRSEEDKRILLEASIS